MELFEQLRREYEFGVGTVKGVARQFGVHRRLVRQAVESALPPLRGYRPRSKPVVGPVAAFIEFDPRGGCDGASQAAPHGAADPSADPG